MTFWRSWPFCPQGPETPQRHDVTSTWQVIDLHFGSAAITREDEWGASVVALGTVRRRVGSHGRRAKQGMALSTWPKCVASKFIEPR